MIRNLLPSGDFRISVSISVRLSTGLPLMRRITSLACRAIKKYILQGNPIKGKIRFFLGYSGWECEQLIQEIKENTWIISKEENTYLMNEDIKGMWKPLLGRRQRNQSFYIAQSLRSHIQFEGQLDHLFQSYHYCRFFRLHLNLCIYWNI